MFSKMPPFKPAILFIGIMIIALNLFSVVVYVSLQVADKLSLN